MADIKPFKCIRPKTELADQVAALPYDVYNRAEAREAVKNKPYTFLRIDRPETQFDEATDMYSDQVYARARDLLEADIRQGVYERDGQDAYYIYELIMDGRSQTGIVACASIDDYLNNSIKKHENTRAEKEEDRIRHVDTCNAQTGPIFLAYRSNPIISQIVARTKDNPPLYSFIAEDGVGQRVWKLADSKDIAIIKEQFSRTEEIYIADGHHRAASAVKVGLKRRAAKPDYDGSEEFNYFLSVLFPEDQLMIMPYNRVVKDTNGLSVEEFIDRVSADFTVTKAEGPVSPNRKYTYGMYLDKVWYQLEAKDRLKAITDSVDSLDVALLQDYLLEPILGIKDPRTDKRIDFIGGIRGLGELERRCSLDMTIAFSMYPTSIQELFAVADAGLLMPPKSTWFEPKLRSGLFIHQL